jgi:hypothetical protein
LRGFVRFDCVDQLCEKIVHVLSRG